LGKDILAWLHFVPIEQDHPSHDLARANVKTHAVTMLQRTRGIGKQCQRDVEHVGDREASWSD